jgi:hypothetical protein
MRLESCFCPSCGHYNAEAGKIVSKQADEIARLKEAILHLRGYVKLWTDDHAAGLKPTAGSLSDARELLSSLEMKP